MLKDVLIDRRFRAPRRWSNRELLKFSKLFNGDVVNVSAWQDADKEGRVYRDYFVKSSSYSITNFRTEARGFQGREGEIFLDLEAVLPESLVGQFDVVLNHTVLEHIFDFRKAFANLTLLSSDVVIVIVPFLQEWHGEYGDFWRFSPEAILRLFAENNLFPLYLNYNRDSMTSVYLFAIASKYRDKWHIIKTAAGNCIREGRFVSDGTPGGGIIRNTLAYALYHRIRNTTRHLLKKVTGSKSGSNGFW